MFKKPKNKNNNNKILQKIFPKNNKNQKVKLKKIMMISILVMLKNMVKNH